MVTEQRESAPQSPATVAAPTRGENLVVWVLWLTYGAFYFCRTNISAAVPGLKASLAKDGLGFTPEQVGMILGSLKISYGVGQLLNGQLSERVSPRKLLATGMLCSAALNVVFGLSEGFYFLLFVWAANGYFQSLGWTPCMRVTANWIPVLRRGQAIGVIGTGYQVTQVLTFVVAGAAAQGLGWRGALYAPAGLLVAAAIGMLVFLKESPTEDAAPDADANQPATRTVVSRNSIAETLWLTLSNPALWLLGISLGSLNACRYGYLDWGVTHLKELQDTGIGDAALKYAILPVGAVAGSFSAGWLTDRFFAGRRAPVICLLLLVLAGLSFFYESVVRSSAAGTICLLPLIGFCIYGPQVLLVGTAPADLARGGTSAAACGFVNFLGYMGAAAGDYVTGYYLDQSGWQVAIYIWAAWALIAAIAAALLWNTTARDASGELNQKGR